MASKWIYTLAGLLVSAGLTLAQTVPSYSTPSMVPVMEGATHLPVEQGTSVGLESSSDACSTSDGTLTWLRGEYLYWKVREQKIPVIVGSIPATQAAQGTLPPGTITPLFGGDAERIHYSGENGGRFTAGRWFDASQDSGLEVSGFYIGEDRLTFGRTTLGPTIVGPVFDDPVVGQQTILFPLDPAQQASSVSIESTNRLMGGELNARRRGTAIFFADRLDVLCGVRYLQFDESFNQFAAITPVPGSGLASVGTFDNFNVHNRFYGAQVGFVSHLTCGRFFVDTTGKLALGMLHRSANINGGTTIDLPPDVNAGLSGGVLAQPTNSGSFDNARFSVMPEVTINTGMEVRPGVKVFLGYNFLFINNVIRAGGLLDPVDARQVPGLRFPDPTPGDVARPRTEFRDARFWVHGVNAGFELNF